MSEPLLVVDLQLGFINEFTRHIPGRIMSLIETGDYAPILFTRFVNSPDSPYQRLLDWHGCATPPETELVRELAPFADAERVFTKLGMTGMPDELGERLRRERYSEVCVVGVDTDMCVLKTAMDVFDLGIEPIVLVDCCASTAGLDERGRFTSDQVDVGRALAADRRVKAKHTAPKGMKDRGD